MKRAICWLVDSWDDFPGTWATLITICVLGFAVLALAEDIEKPNEIGGPLPIPAERHEEISRAMLAVQEAQIERVNLDKQYETAKKQADERADRTMKAFQDLLAKLQREFNATGCGITLEKTWNCQKETAK